MNKNTVEKTSEKAYSRPNAMNDGCGAERGGDMGISVKAKQAESDKIVAGNPAGAIAGNVRISAKTEQIDAEKNAATKLGEAADIGDAGEVARGETASSLLRSASINQNGNMGMPSRAEASKNAATKPDKTEGGSADEAAKSDADTETSLSAVSFREGEASQEKAASAHSLPVENTGANKQVTVHSSDAASAKDDEEITKAAGANAGETSKDESSASAATPFTHLENSALENSGLGNSGRGRRPLLSAQAHLFGGRRARAGKRHIRRSRRLMGRACSGAYIRLRALSEQIFFSSLTRRIVILNFAALCALLAAILYMNQFRDGLIEAKMDNLRLQGRIIAGAIAASATADTGTVYVHPLTSDGPRDGNNMVETWYFPIDTHRVEMILSRVISPAVTRAVIYDRDDNMLLDSRSLYSDGRISSYSLPPIDDERPGFFRRIYEGLHHWIFGQDSMPYIGSKNIANQVHKEVLQAMQGKIVTSQSRNVQGELIVSVAVPIQRYHAILGVLLLSTAGSDIDGIVHAERLSIFKNFAAVAFVMLVLSLFLSAAIAIPLRRLSDAAQRVRLGTNKRVKIPDYSFRRDEIGHLSASIGQMTDALYSRIETIGSFAADVSHELKNPLTSLRSAAETLPLAKTEEARKSLLDIINHDVRRLNRLITDIAGASRLDAELAREDTSPVDLLELMNNLVRSAREVRKKRRQAVIDFTAEPLPGGRSYYVSGHELRLAQIFSNLIENARSFIPEEGGRIAVHMKRDSDFIIVTVEDNGPGIRAKNIERIFERFYTDRPAGESFGQNSGLGLSISRQIAEAHRGTLTAENIYAAGDAEHIEGARFIVRLPALDEKQAAAAQMRGREKTHSPD